jgi:hypothetical protein
MKKKFDIFNFFFSSAAVVILIGVIAKILEWPSQDLLITMGLSIEALVFGVSSIRFIEVSKSKKVATETTLSKMADNLATGKQTKNDDEALISPDKTIPIGNESESSSTTKSTILDKLQTEEYTMSNFKKLKYFNISDDFYFQLEWFILPKDEYNSLKNLIHELFGKNLPEKSDYLFLKNSPIELPEYSFSDLILVKPVKMSRESLSLLINSFKLVKFKDFLSKFILSEINNKILIRSRKNGESQVYFEESSLVSNYIKSHYNHKLVKAPVMSVLEPLIALKGEELVRYLVDDLEVQDLVKLTDLAELTIQLSDTLKMYLIIKIGHVEFNMKTKKELDVLVPLIKILLALDNTNTAKENLNKLLSLKIDQKTILRLQDVVYFNDSQIYFGDQNEYNLNITDLFSSDQLGIINYFESVMELTSSNEMREVERVRKLFGLDEFNTITELHQKMNRYIATRQEGKPKAGQIAFILLHKQFSK